MEIKQVSQGNRVIQQQNATSDPFDLDLKLMKKSKMPPSHELNPTKDMGWTQKCTLPLRCLKTHGCS